MKITSPQSASDRFAGFLKNKRSFLIAAGVDVDAYLVRVEQSGALFAITELLKDAEAQDLHLPLGYWSFIHRRKEELEKLDTNGSPH